MPYCVIKGCKNSSCDQKKANEITFHEFSAEKTWKENLIKTEQVNRNDTDWLPSKSSVICCVHFDNHDIYTGDGCHKIKENAIPKKIHLVSSIWCETIEQSDIDGDSMKPELNSEHLFIDERVGTAENVSCTPDISNLQESASDRNSEDSGSEVESILNTLKEQKLRQQTRKLQRLYKIHVRKIRSLNQKVNRLQKRNALLKTALKY